MAQGDGSAIRKRMNIPSEALVIGHTGRLAPEKNLQFLAEAVTEFIDSHRSGCSSNGPRRWLRDT